MERREGEYQTTNRSNCFRNHSCFRPGTRFPAAGAQAPTDSGSAVLPSPGLFESRPWEYGPFVNGGLGTGDRADYKFLWAGLHAGKVLTDPLGKGMLRGQFELAAEFIPLWQAYTPKYLRANCYAAARWPADRAVICFPRVAPTPGSASRRRSCAGTSPAATAFGPGFRVRAASSGPLTSFRR